MLLERLHHVMFLAVEDNNCDVVKRLLADTKGQLLNEVAAPEA